MSPYAPELYKLVFAGCLVFGSVNLIVKSLRTVSRPDRVGVCEWRREVAHHHNDGEHLCCPDSSLALEKPERQGGVLAGDSGTGGLPTRLFDLFKGSHWTLIGYEVERLSGVKPRPVLHTTRSVPVATLLMTAGIFMTVTAFDPATGFGRGRTVMSA